MTHTLHTQQHVIYLDQKNFKPKILLWSKTFGGGTADASDKMQDIAIDSNGFLITAGQIQGPASFVSVGASEDQSIGGVTDDYSWILKIKKDTGLID